MFETFELQILQQYWWIIISVLGSLLVFLMFVQGGQTLIYTLGKDETQRTMIINTLGRKWEFTFTTLVTFGGAFFASFPLFYSTSFGGAYWVWMLILFAFVLQAVSYEYRKKPSNFLGARTFEIFLLVNGFIGTVLIGTAVGTFFTGAEFFSDKMNITRISNPVISYWATPWHGLEAALDVRNLALGLTVFFLARILGSLYIANSVQSDEILKRVKKQLVRDGIPFLLVFLFFTGNLLLMKGYALNPADGSIFIETHKYLHNLLEMPLVLIFFITGAGLVVFGLLGGIFARTEKMIWFAGTGTILTVFSLFLIAGFNNTPFYPSKADPAASLTIYNASSSHYTLAAMSYVSLLVPFVVAYIWYAWKSVNRKKINSQELETSAHVY